MSTYEEFKNAPSSEKLTLAQVNASKLLRGMSLESGSIYKIDLSEVIESVEDSGVALTEVASLGAITPGDYYHDRTNSILYLETSDSADPNGKFIVAEVKFFFSNAGVNAPNDFSTGFEVHWLPYLRPLSQFANTLDNQNQIGFAIEGTGSISFFNDQSFWKSRYDKYFFENKICKIYSWNSSLPFSEAKLIYRGRIQEKSWSSTQITFRLKDFINELRAEIPLAPLSDLGGVTIPATLENVRQRRIYGYAFSLRPTNVDQLIDDKFTLTGTFAVTTSSATVTGSGTSFLSELSPDDTITFGDDDESFTIESIASDTSLTLTEVYSLSSQSGVSAQAEPSHDKRFLNRKHLIAGHALATITSTVTAAFSFLMIEVADASAFEAGAAITVGSQNSFIDHISNNRLFLSLSLSTLPSIGSTVTQDPVLNVKINNTLLIKTRDYTFDASGPSFITLDDLAEFNVARVKSLVGTSIAFTTSSRDVTGTGTVFTSQLKPGDWIRPSGESDFFEILEVTDDTNIVLRTASTYTTTAAGQYKTPDIYTEGTDILTVDALGITEDRTTSGTFIYKGPMVVEDIIKSVGIDTADIDTTSFSTTSDIEQARVGIVIPKQFNSTKSRSARDIINDINQSIFGSLLQNDDLKLEYKILSPKKTDFTSFGVGDILGFSIKSKSDQVVKTVRVDYQYREYDPNIRTSGFMQVTAINDYAQYLVKTEKEFTLESVLIDETDAQILANRYSFLKSVATSILSLKMKLQPVGMEIGDQIELEHEKLYERLGSSTSRKVGAIQFLGKSGRDTSLQLDDLANAFTRAAVIAPDAHPDFTSSTDSEKSIAGYITDSVGGTINNDPETAEINLIW